jgi:DNA-binding XRE family transcriptional regulator
MTLKEYRIQNDLTAAQMGLLIGVAHSTILRWESGRLSPAGDSISRIVRVTGGAVMPNDLFQAEVAA